MQIFLQQSKENDIRNKTYYTVYETKGIINVPLIIASVLRNVHCVIIPVKMCYV